MSLADAQEQEQGEGMEDTVFSQQDQELVRNRLQERRRRMEEQAEKQAENQAEKQAEKQAETLPAKMGRTRRQGKARRQRDISRMGGQVMGGKRRGRSYKTWREQPF